jgi:hypothetical protein
MKKSRINVVQKKRGRPATGQDPTTSIRLSTELRTRIDEWAAQRPDKPTRTKAIRQLIELGLKEYPASKVKRSQKD